MGFNTGFNVFQQGTRHPFRAVPMTKVSPFEFVESGVAQRKTDAVDATSC